jgi:alkaline phosphatase D
MKQTFSNQKMAARQMPRRRFIKTSAKTAALVAGASVVGFPAILQAKPRNFAFQHGVASGDPLPDGFIIWTRVTPTLDALPGLGVGEPSLVGWEVALDAEFRHRVAKGVVHTGPKLEHTVKVDVTGLKPETSYFYRFLFKDAESRVGHARTAPAPDAMIQSLRFGLASCSNYEGGFFSAYRHMANRGDLDFVLHVGDYIYEYGSGSYGPGAAIGRVHAPVHEIVSLSDYRRRHAQYKLDPDLQMLHAAYPFICTWDDHELTNDSWKAGAENHQPATEGDFINRRNNAYRAYFEWMPIRLPSPEIAPSRIYRNFQFGALVGLSMLDLRQYRDVQPLNGLDPTKDNPERVIVGAEQLNWLKQNLSSQSAQWKLVGNSVMIAPVDFRQPLPPEILQQLGLMAGVPFNVDSWDGYTDDRRELLEFISGAQIQNVGFLTGDIHSSWACDLPLDAGAYAQGVASVAVELVGTSITSDNLNEILGLPPRNPISQQVETVFKAGNRHVKYLEFDSHGYSVVDISRERMQMDWISISDRTDPDASQHFAESVIVANGTNSIQPGDGPLGLR